MTAILIFLITILLLFIGICYYIHTIRKGKELVDKHLPYMLYGRILK